ncbi:SDR family NAD(P)-dependent oxidoreductase [candidate division KSB3 bacterium]|uniref:SDR family NAD(P)-dependent oxidoreductase n=1 Tax=candidate division KSB3 bacterium TaxID=2044937 RepID=A0A9D5JVC4_9BACT|nr:SDR family NAD(P)-dependent oxidoreductase [candidate division KSB3 bacterium]MBD3324607.1 SDR family NAD(P)-dependent oxidoreductase [candidate division KSB3 bacterium]
MPETYLVTGATGSIGSAVVRYAARQGHTVRVFVRNAQKARNVFAEELANAPDTLEIITGDILQKESLAPAIQGASVLFHCTNFPITLFERNLEAMRNVMDLALEQGCHVIYPGNVWVYGKPQTVPIPETHPKQPCARLGEIKLRLDEMCMEYFQRHRLPVTILHLPDFYGPWVMNAWMQGNYEAALHGKPMQMLGNMQALHEFIYIDEAARAMNLVAQEAHTFGQHYNVPGYGGITLEDFSRYLYEAAGTTGKIRTAPAWLLRLMGIFNKEIGAFLEMRYLFEDEILLDGTKIKDAVGYVPEIDYRTGTQRTMYWYKNLTTSERSRAS